jgi:two-component system response regulator
MSDQPVEVLLVEDNPRDAELTMRALSKRHLANHVAHVTDGQAALDFLFREGPYAQRGDAYPQVVLLDLKLPKVDGIEVLRQIRGEPTPESASGGRADLLARGKRHRQDLPPWREQLHRQARGI